MTERLVVIGGDAAGMSTASQARKRRGADQLEIVAFERGEFTSYSACGIPYFVGDVVHSAEELIARSPAEFAEAGIAVRLRHEVVGIDTGRGEVTVRDLSSGAERREGYDQLMVATGSVPVRPDVPGADAGGIFGVQVLGDGVAIRKAVEADPRPRRAVVIGGGYIGIEMAEAMIERGLEVTLVDRSPQPMNTLDPDMGALVADALSGLGVQLFLGEGLEAYETADGRVTAVVTSERTLPCDLVVLGLGVRPNSGLADAAGIETGVTGGIVVDRRMHTRSERVWAAGDCVEVHHRVSRRPAAIALGTHANKQGRVAGINLGGGYATFPGVIGTAVSKVCAYEVARTGLRAADATAEGFETECVTVRSTTRAGYFPGATPITTKLIAEKRSGRLLGAQIVGQEGAAKRIDVLACAIWNEMAVDEIAHLDLSYAPPFAPVWDPVLIAARKAWEQVEASAPATR